MQQTDFGLAAVSFLSSSYLVRCSVCFSLLLLPFNTIPVATKSFRNLFPEVNKSFRLFAVFSSTNTNCFSVPKHQVQVQNKVRFSIWSASAHSPDAIPTTTTPPHKRQTTGNFRFPPAALMNHPLIGHNSRYFFWKGDRFTVDSGSCIPDLNTRKATTKTDGTPCPCPLSRPPQPSHFGTRPSLTHIHTRSAATTKKNSFSRQQKSPSKNFPTF